jgi:hypothetical protein
MLANIVSLSYQLTRTGPVTRLTVLEISGTMASACFSITAVILFPLLNKMTETTGKNIDLVGKNIELTARVGDMAHQAHERLDRLE